MNIPYLDLKAVTALHGDEIQQAVARVVSSGWYLQGEAVQQFEAHYAAYIGTRHCIGVANGLDALTLTLRAYVELGRLRPGDEVLVPANTFIATVLAITEAGLTPVFVDVEADTLLPSPALLRGAVGPRTRALMLVHLYGRCTYSEAARHLCARHHLLLIEDNAQAHGCRCSDGRRTGSLGHAGCHSFYPGKNLGALGDGGAVTTDDDQLAATLRAIANYGFERKYVARYLGRNSRLDEVQAAVLDVKLRHLDHDNARRQAIASAYRQAIASAAHPLRLPSHLDDPLNVFHIFPVFTPRRDALQARLAGRGIHTLVHYPIPPHRQQCYAQFRHLSLPVAERLAAEELSLPLHPAMTDEQVRYVADTLLTT